MRTTPGALLLALTFMAGCTSPETPVEILRGGRP